MDLEEGEEPPVAHGLPAAAPAYPRAGLLGPGPGFPGAAPAGGFGAAPAGGFGAAPAGGFGVAPAGGFGVAPAGGFGAAPAGGFGAAPAGGFGVAPAGGLLRAVPAGGLLGAAPALPVHRTFWDFISSYCTEGSLMSFGAELNATLTDYASRNIPNRYVNINMTGGGLFINIFDNARMSIPDKVGHVSVHNDPTIPGSVAHIIDDRSRIRRDINFVSEGANIYTRFRDGYNPEPHRDIFGLGRYLLDVLIYEIKGNCVRDRPGLNRVASNAGGGYYEKYLKYKLKYLKLKKLSNN